jgi:heme exporter protein A
MPSADVLQAERLAARRGFVTLFSDVGFSLREGECLVVSGANGSGKTTLLRMLAGLTQPADGEIRWRRRSVRPFDPQLRDAVAFNGHLPALKDELTAEENLASWVALDNGAPARRHVIDALDWVSLGRQRRVPVRVLSQGQRRRIGLARLRLVARPLWILDEPLTALDVDGIELLRNLLDRHLEAGGVCVAASHQQLPLSGMRERTLTLGTTVAS